MIIERLLSRKKKYLKLFYPIGTLLNSRKTVIFSWYVKCWKRSYMNVSLSWENQTELLKKRNRSTHKFEIGRYYYICVYSFFAFESCRLILAQFGESAHWGINNSNIKWKLCLTATGSSFFFLLFYIKFTKIVLGLPYIS